MQQQFQQEESSRYVARTLDQLTNRREEARLEAEERLKELGAKALEDLLKIFKQEAQKLRTRRIWILTGVALYLVIMVLSVLKHHHLGNLGMIGGMTGAIAAGLAVSQRQKMATKQLALLEDIRIVGPLAEALEFEDSRRAGRKRPAYRVGFVCRVGRHDPSWFDLVSSRLIDLLPRLQSSDAGLLNAEQRACLCRALNGYDRELSRAILKAFQQVGDSKALPFVERLAKGEGRAAEDPTLQQEAQECLLFLGPRVKNEIAHQQLLRAADQNDSALDILLRPAAGAVETAPQELLRASGSEPQTLTPVQALFLEDQTASS